MTKPVQCNLEHPRARPAAVRIQVKSTRLGRPGHPLVRELALCAAHARVLRELGVEVIEP